MSNPVPSSPAFKPSGRGVAPRFSWSGFRPVCTGSSRCARFSWSRSRFLLIRSPRAKFGGSRSVRPLRFSTPRFSYPDSYIHQIKLKISNSIRLLESEIKKMVIIKNFIKNIINYFILWSKSRSIAQSIAWFIKKNKFRFRTKLNPVINCYCALVLIEWK